MQAAAGIHTAVRTVGIKQMLCARCACVASQAISSMEDSTHSSVMTAHSIDAKWRAPKHSAASKVRDNIAGQLILLG
jgi:hypothetical protein